MTSEDLPATYIVGADEQLWDIAQHFHLHPQTIWEHGENAGLRRQRHRPEAISEGDRLYLPAPSPRVEDCETDKVHRFRLDRQLLGLRVQIVRSGSILSDTPVELRCGSGQVMRGTTDEHGFFEAHVGIDEREAQLVLDPGRPYEWTIPVIFDGFVGWNSIKGSQQRLRNLGYRAVEPTGQFDDATFAATLDFQERTGLVADGFLNEETMGKIERLHDTGLYFNMLQSAKGEPQRGSDADHSSRATE